MKKQIIIIIIVLLIVVGLDMWMMSFVNSRMDNLISDLNIIKADIMGNNDELASAKIEEKYNKLLDDWSKLNKSFTIMLEHNELEKIEEALVFTNTARQTKNIDDSIVGIDKAVFLLEHLKEKETVNLRNVF